MLVILTAKFVNAETQIICDAKKVLNGTTYKSFPYDGSFTVNFDKSKIEAKHLMCGPEKTTRVGKEELYLACNLDPRFGDDPSKFRTLTINRLTGGYIIYDSKFNTFEEGKCKKASKAF